MRDHRPPDSSVRNTFKGGMTTLREPGHQVIGRSAYWEVIGRVWAPLARSTHSPLRRIMGVMEAHYVQPAPPAVPDPNQTAAVFGNMVGDPARQIHRSMPRPTWARTHDDIHQPVGTLLRGRFQEERDLLRDAVHAALWKAIHHVS